MKYDRKLHAGRRTGQASRHGSAGRAKREMTIQQALEWTFRTEKAQLELPEPPDPERTHRAGFGLEYVLLQRAVLGTKVDGGQHKMGGYTHPDAEVIAATVAGLPDDLGGKRMAIRVAELARAGLTPDWMPGAVPRCVPVETKRNQYGDHAKTVVVRTARIRGSGPTPRGKWKTIDIMACPVTYTPHPQQIEAARRGYRDWWRALEWLRDMLAEGRMLRDVAVNGALPRVHPWAPVLHDDADSQLR